MTSDEFNEKYKNYLEPGHYGLGFDIPLFTEWLDAKFQQFILIPGFKYTQIKTKFGSGRFYCNNVSSADINEVEDKITLMCKTENQHGKIQRQR